MTSTSTRNHFRQGRTATPCPVWCITDHDAVDEVEGPAGHASAIELIYIEGTGQPVKVVLYSPGNGEAAGGICFVGDMDDLTPAEAREVAAALIRAAGVFERTTSKPN